MSNPMSYGGETVVNANELRAEFVRKGYTQKQVAEKLHISSKTLSNKLRKGVFGSDEIEQLMIILDISNPVPIFFSSEVTLKVTSASLKEDT